MPHSKHGDCKCMKTSDEIGVHKTFRYKSDKSPTTSSINLDLSIMFRKTPTDHFLWVVMCAECRFALRPSMSVLLIFVRWSWSVLSLPGSGLVDQQPISSGKVVLMGLGYQVDKTSGEVAKALLLDFELEVTDGKVEVLQWRNSTVQLCNDNCVLVYP